MNPELLPKNVPVKLFLMDSRGSRVFQDSLQRDPSVTLEIINYDQCNEAIKVEFGDLGNSEWNSIKRVSIVEATCFRSVDRVRRYSKLYL